MIKLKDDFDVDFQDIIDMDLKFAYILDLFNVNDLHTLIKQREEILETYLLDCNSEQEFEKKKHDINKYFNNKTFTNDLIEIMNRKYKKEV